MCVREIDPKETTRTLAFELWMKAPNPMVTFFKTYDVMPLIKVSKSRGMKSVSYTHLTLPTNREV